MMSVNEASGEMFDSLVGRGKEEGFFFFYVACGKGAQASECGWSASTVAFAYKQRTEGKRNQNQLEIFQ